MQNSHHFINIIKGVGAVIIAWSMFAVLAFTIFALVDVPASVIIITWFIIIIPCAILATKIKWLTVHSWVWTSTTLLILVMLFLMPVNSNIPQQAHELNKQLIQQHDDRYAYAHTLMDNLTGRWTTPVRQYFLEPHKVFFIRDFSYFWHRQNEYADSNIQAHMYYQLLLNSSLFSNDEVSIIRTWCLNSPHSYVGIAHEQREIFVDLWAANRLEDYQFGMYATMPCQESSGQAFIQ